jgi:hypothetical protein
MQRSALAHTDDVVFFKHQRMNSKYRVDSGFPLCAPPAIASAFPITMIGCFWTFPFTLICRVGFW